MCVALVFYTAREEEREREKEPPRDVISVKTNFINVVSGCGLRNE